jgi:hypothetical protein
MSLWRNMADFKKGETSFAKLTRAGDFDLWQFRMQLYLQGIGVFSIVDGLGIAPTNPNRPVETPATTATTTPETEAATPAGGVVPTRAPADRQAIKDWRDYRQRRDMAVTTIMQGITEELAKRYRNPIILVNPAKLWQQIEADGHSKIKLDVHHLRLQLTEVKLEECGSVDDYVDRFQQICNQIVLAGKMGSDGEKYFFIMEGHPPQEANGRYRRRLACPGLRNKLYLNSPARSEGTSGTLPRQFSARDEGGDGVRNRQNIQQTLPHGYCQYPW